LENILSPQNTPLFKSIPYKPPTKLFSLQTSTDFAYPKSCNFTYASIIVVVIHVSACPLRFIFEHSVITSLKTLLKVTLKSVFFKMCFMLFEILSFSGNRTKRGFGDHHKIGSPSLNQGKIPFL